jgi:outer membrane protein OmpA-like peptidoglycan-associated protein
MSFNLVEAANNLIAGELVDKAGSFLGESETGVRKALTGIVPAVLGGLATKSSTGAGADAVFRMVNEQSQAQAEPAGFFGNDNTSLLNKGAALLGNIFGDKVSSLAGLLSGFSGIRPPSASSLLSIVAPIIVGFLGKHASSNHLNASGLSNLLSSQKENINHAVPSGLNLESIIEKPSLAGHVATHAAPASHYSEEVADTAGSAIKWLLPVLLLVLLAAAAWYLYSGKDSKSESETTSTMAETTVKEQPAAVAEQAPAGRVDTSGNYIYDLGKMITIDLPNGAGALTVGENSTENRLYKFLSDPAAKIDTVKGNWFEFTNVRFLTGGTKVDSASSNQLKNVVAISKAFPAASFKLGGYTDNVGDAVFNTTLSQKRADAVAAELKKMGASAKAITGAKGYGPQYPIGDNGTTEGKAMNRRVAINVKSK